MSAKIEVTLPEPPEFNLSAEQEAVIDATERKIRTIEKAIFDLETVRDEVANEGCGEYEEYLRHMAHYYPTYVTLGRREYYPAAAELDWLHKTLQSLNPQDVDGDWTAYDAFEAKYADRFAHLEHVLGA